MCVAEKQKFNSGLNCSQKCILLFRGRLALSLFYRQFARVPSRSSSSKCWQTFLTECRPCVGICFTGGLFMDAVWRGSQIKPPMSHARVRRRIRGTSFLKLPFKSIAKFLKLWQMLMLLCQFRIKIRVRTPRVFSRSVYRIVLSLGLTLSWYF